MRVCMYVCLSISSYCIQPFYYAYVKYQVSWHEMRQWTWHFQWHKQRCRWCQSTDGSPFCHASTRPFLLVWRTPHIRRVSAILRLTFGWAWNVPTSWLIQLLTAARAIDYDSNFFHPPVKGDASSYSIIRPNALQSVSIFQRGWFDIAL